MYKIFQEETRITKHVQKKHSNFKKCRKYFKKKQESQNISKKALIFFGSYLAISTFQTYFYKIQKLNQWKIVSVITHWTHTFLNPGSGWRMAGDLVPQEAPLIHDVGSLCISTMWLFNPFLGGKNRKAGAAGEGYKWQLGPKEI